MPKDGFDVKLDGQGQPLWLCLELTYRCPLKCPWCSNPLDFDQYANEMTTEEWKDVLRQGRKLGSLQLGFTGGEPLLRRDLEELVDYADKLGYYTNLITSGVGMTEDRLTALKAAGLKQIQLSIQSCKSETTDALVGARAHEQKLHVARMIKAKGFPMVLNVPVLRQNVEQVDDILTMAETLGVDYLEFANIQYYNWALVNRAEIIPTREQVLEAERAVNKARERIGDAMTIYFVIPDYYDGKPKACMNGWGSIHLTISPEGLALPCQEAAIMKGVTFPSVREHDLAWIWHQSPAFNLFRGDLWMGEPCRTCPDKEKDFGGCRCQAYLMTGDARNTDPACTKSPHHHLIEEAIADAFRPGHNSKPLMLRRVSSAESLRAGG